MLIFNELNSALYAPIPKDIYTASLIINKMDAVLCNF